MIKTDFDWNKIKSHLEGINYAEHMGDVYRELPGLCKELGLPNPIWDDNWGDDGAYVMGWERD